MNAIAEQILKQNKLSATPSRNKILELFLNSNYALVVSEIEKEVHSLDRITTYRTLQIFLMKGIIHLIPSPINLIKYALSKQNKKNQLSRNHLHFFCHNCQKTTCLYEINVPDIKLPKGYKERNKDLIISGICGYCI